MNSKAQGFDVFKLLISAVVAVVILTILLQILNPKIWDQQNNAIDESKTLLESATSNINSLKIKNDVVFEKDTVITSIGLKESSYKITKDDICILKDSGLSDSTWTATNKSIVYNGSNDFATTISAICYYPEDVKNGYEQFLTDSAVLPDMYSFDTLPSETECCSENASICCLIMVKRSN